MIPMASSDVEHILIDAAIELGREKGFEFLTPLPSHSKGVFLVEDEGGYKVLKLLDSRAKKVDIEGTETDFNVFSAMKALYLESLALDIVDAERLPNVTWYEGPPLHVKGLTRFFDMMHNPTRIALLKEFIAGAPLGEWNRTGYTAKSYVQKDDFSLADTVIKIHEAGFSGLDLIPPNIVRNPEGQVYFIDLFNASMKNHLLSVSKSERARDYARLEMLYEDRGQEVRRYIETQTRK